MIIDDCQNYNDDGSKGHNIFHIICPSINKLILNESIVHLTLTRCGIGNKELIILGSAFKINSTIKSLNLSRNEFDSELINFIDILLKNSKLPLNSLDLSFNGIDNSILIGFPSLKNATRLLKIINYPSEIMLKT